MSLTGSTRRAGHLRVNGTDIYHEVRGSGPPVLFISGMTGDAGHYAKVAEVLATEFTAVTYDRRGNSRSPRPPGWGTNADVGLGIEFDAFIGFDPTPVRRPEGIPVVTAAGIENRYPEAFNHFVWETTEWLAKRWGTELVATSGAHVPYLTHPKEFAEQLRALLR